MRRYLPTSKIGLYASYRRVSASLLPITYKVKQFCLWKYYPFWKLIVFTITFPWKFTLYCKFATAQTDFLWNFQQFFFQLTVLVWGIWTVALPMPDAYRDKLTVLFSLLLLRLNLWRAWVFPPSISFLPSGPAIPPITGIQNLPYVSACS